jgi:CheY-like chemotaxis protein
VLTAAEEVVRPLNAQMGHTLTVSPAQEPIRLDGDFVRLVQVVSNLLTNAAKFTPAGGSITLTAEQVGEVATIRVRDNGVGIPRERQRDIFTLFYQEERGLARTRGGLGIGLTLVKRLVELHGGEVSVRSDGEGRGSEFLITLPAEPPSTPRYHLPGVDASRRLTAGGKPLRILLVDDNVDAASSFALLLELGGHQVAVAHESSAALETVRTLSPEIAFIDIGLPGTDGYQLAEMLRAHPGCEGTVFVALTGYGSDADKARASAAGFDHHLTKPADADVVDRLLTNVSEATGPRLEDRGNVH